ncbi:AAA family ATPase [Saccharopolyspora mangrovi]|uniref:AAA family ATPase n=1 Tax=Saccharopolyspora mangrovi TaxID=3082379 RepID=A0ABU6AD81_9PSEU|nr:AAA family ATPase [Saccharopolyspora sp. S2-29]MEB3369423.1 AAA family ATPase [Saccharopolyspora sp. S2-29]
MKPLALLVSGAPASGKTTLGAAAAEHCSAALLDLDVLTGPMVERLGVALDDPCVREARYAALLDTALDTVRIGTSAVLVAPFTAERTDLRLWSATADRIRAAGADPVLVWVDCPPELILERMRGRAAPRDSGTLADPAKLLAARPIEPIGPHVRVDATRPVAAQLAALDRHLRSGREQACAQATSRSTTWPPRPE